MKTLSKETILNIQKTLIGLSVLGTISTLAIAEIGHCKQDDRTFVAGTLGSLFTTASLGMSIGGYLSNPYRKRERD